MMIAFKRNAKQNPAELQLCGVFIPFGQGGLILRLTTATVSVQPFADVVANYSCHDRDKE